MDKTVEITAYNQNGAAIFKHSPRLADVNAGTVDGFAAAFNSLSGLGIEGFGVAQFDRENVEKPWRVISYADAERWRDVTSAELADGIRERMAHGVAAWPQAQLTYVGIDNA